MDWFDTLGNINYWAVLVGVISTSLVGMIWYSPQVLGKPWMKELGIKERDMKNKDGLAKAMAHSTVASFFSASIVAALMLATGTDGWADGAIFGAVIGFGIAMSAMVTHDVFDGTSAKLTKINGLFDVAKFAAMAALMGGIGVLG